MAAGGLLTEVGPWYEGLRKPRLQPPNWLFGPAWAVILGLSATGGVLAWNGAPDGDARVRVILLFAAAGFMHTLWSPLFFKLKRPDWALMEMPFLAVSIVAVIGGIAPYSATAAWLVAPYLAWLCFATYLNWSIVRLNGPFA